MAEHLDEYDPDRETWFFYGIKSREREFMSKRVRQLMARPAFHLRVFYSEPGAEPLREYEEEGRMTIDRIRQELPSSNYEFYICGPPSMMSTMIEGLRSWGVPTSSVHYESFNPRTVRETSRDSPALKDAGTCTVTFQSAGARIEWTPESGTILELAEANGVFLPSGCRAGKCGTCVTPLVSGTFSYVSKPEIDVEDGSCLACVAIPAEDTEFP